jgi:hypothetical protein
VINREDLSKAIYVPTGTWCGFASVEIGQRWMDQMSEPEGWVLEIWPRCRCCGDQVTLPARGPHHRCDRHAGRNPCIIEGCKRTTAAPENGRLSSDEWICGEHWRKYVPPRSRLRRLYHAHFRRGKREGWTMKRNRQFHRFWDFVVRVARKRHEGGFLDEAEIARLMGWDVAEPA